MYKRFLVLLFSFILLFVYWIYIKHVTNYFFLFDDYALLHLAQKNDFLELGKSQIGFYRPLTFVLFKFQFSIFNWTNPEHYALVSLFFHTMNALLVSLLCNRILGKNVFIAFTAFNIFLLSPWSSETYFWFSSQFDIFATFFLLISMLLAQKSINPTEGFNLKTVYFIVISAISSLGAMFCKESAITIPFLFVSISLVRFSPKEILNSKVFFITFFLLVGSAITYMIIRSTMLDAFGGAYGSFFSMLAEANPIKAVRAYLGPPIGFSSATITKIGAIFYVAVLSGLILCALRYKFRQSIMLLLSLIIAIAPVSIFRTHANAIPGGRFLYLPGIFLALLLCIGLNRLLFKVKEENHFFSVFRYSLGLFWVYLLISVNFQNNWWMMATSISRNCIEQFSQYIDKGKFFYISNLPSRFKDGPYLLKSYAFPYYYQNEDMNIRSHAEILAFENGKIETIDGEIDTFAPFEASDKRITVTFNY